MTLNYVCRKCGKAYSQQECSGNRFCASCGSFLVKQFIVPACTDAEETLVKTKLENPKAGQIRENPELKRAAENLRQRSETTKEYEVLSEPEKPANSGQSGSEGWLFESDYDQALKLKSDLTSKFEGKSLEEAIRGKVVSNEQGECYCVSENHNVPFQNVSPQETRRRLLSDLKFLSGIGPAREKALKQQGYHTIEALAAHPKWRKSAGEFLRLVDSKDVPKLQRRLRRSLPKSHPLSHYLAGFCQDKDFAIVDIETLGLFGRPIILVGLADVTKRGVRTRQFLVRDISEEACALWEFTSRLGEGSAFVSFNGRCFDLPFIRERMAYYGLSSLDVFENPHFDVLHFARRALGDKLANCRLETVEKYMGIRRGVNIPGALVPEFYDSYQRSGNVGPLVAIVEHNKQDLVTLAQLFCSLYKEWNL